jgi:hypothetical protein
MYDESMKGFSYIKKWGFSKRLFIINKELRDAGKPVIL